MSLSEAGRAAAYKRANADPFWYLVTIEHPDLPTTLRFVAREKNESVVSNDETYIAFPFEISFPDSQEDQPPQSHVRISAISDPENPDEDVVTILRNITRGKPTIGLKTVLKSQPDVVEMEAPGMILSGVDFDRLTIEGDLSFEDILNEPYPGNSYNKAEWPGAHP